MVRICVSPPVVRATAVFLLLTVIAPQARADAFEAYRRIGDFNLPAGTAAFDVLPDGRLVAITGSTIHVETAVRSRLFAVLGALDGSDIPSFGAAFLRVSPDGTRVAIGNNGGALGNNSRVGIYSFPGLVGQWFAAAHFDAEWADDDRLAISHGDFVDPSVVSILNVNSSDTENPQFLIVINGIGGASAGVAFDASGNLFTGNGFAFDGPSGTGTVKAFTAADWEDAYANQIATAFESGGQFILDVLSASPLAFDHEGNLVVAGGDFNEVGQSDFVGIARAAVVTGAATGVIPVDINDPAELRRIDPDTNNNSNFYTVVANAPLAELYVRDFGSQTVHVYLDTTNIPASSDWGLLCLALACLCAGSVVLIRADAPGASTQRAGSARL